MYTSEIVFVYNNLACVSVTHVSIFWEVIQRIKLKDDTVTEVTTKPRYKITMIKS